MMNPISYYLYTTKILLGKGNSLFMKMFALEQNSGIAKIMVVSACLVIFIGVMTFVGWLGEIKFLAGIWSSGYIATSPTTSFFFILLGLLIVLGSFQKENKIPKVLSIVIVSIIAFYGILRFLSMMFGIDLTLNDFLFHFDANRNGFSFHKMSPYTGILFFISGVSLLLKLFYKKHTIVLNIVSGVGVFVCFAGFVALTGYVFDTPFFYSFKETTISLFTSIAFILLGISMISIGGSHTIFTRHFCGITSSAFVLRVFLPLIISGILVESFLFVQIARNHNVNLVLLVSLLTLTSIVLTIIVIVFVSKIVFKRADVAEIKRKKAEEIIQQERILMRTLIDNLPVTIYVKDIEGRKRLANNADVKATGHQREEEILGKTDVELFNQQDGAHGYNQDLQVISTGIALLDDEKDYVDSSGEVKWLRTSKIPLKDNKGEIIGLVGVGFDITAKKAQEEQMLLMNHALKSLNDCISITDINDKIIYVNNAFLNTYGYERTELIGENIKIVRKKDEQSDFVETILPSTKELGWHGEIINCKKDGTEFNVSLSTSPVRNEAGEVIALAGIATNITERKAMEEALERSKEKYQTLIENQGEGLVLVDLNEVFTFVNPATEQIFGVEKGALIGRSLIDFVTTESLKLIREETEKRVDKGKSTYEIDVIAADGQKKSILITATPQVNAAGVHIGAFGIFRDITAQKIADAARRKSEEKYRILVESMPDGVYKRDLNGHFIEINPALVKMLGYKSKKEVYDKDSLVRIFPKRSVRNLIFSKPNSEEVNEYQLITKNKSVIWVEDHSHKVIDPEDGSEWHEGIIRNITERKIIETQLAKQSDELRELNSTKDKFFSIIAHDLRSPFGAILGLSDMLVTDFDEFDLDSIHESVIQIDKASKQAFSLLENLLEWARSQTGKMEFTPIEFDLVSVIQETIGVAQTFAKKKGVRLEAIIPEKQLIVADKNMIHTVLRNLISNALKFTPQKGNVIVSLRVTKHHIVFSVADSGVGISQENVDKLFKIGGSFTNPGTNNEKGTGLGLVLCKEFIEKHQGEIWVESKLNAGSTFLVKIPIVAQV